MSNERQETLLERIGQRASYRAAVPIAIVFVVLLLNISYLATPAWVWDETYYYTLSSGVARWAAAPTLDPDRIREVFREGNAHPPLPLYVMAITSSLFESPPDEVGAPPVDFLLAVRLATCLQFAALALVVFYFVKKEAGALAAVFATVLTVLSPRLFAHSLMATYDVPMALFWLATTVAFYHGMHSKRWAVACALAFGLALLTKVNALLLPLALWPWGLYYHRSRALRAIGWMAALGPLVFFALWPWLWTAPLRHFAEYIVDKFPAGAVPAFILSWTGTEAVAWREPARTLYFGSVRAAGAPWHYPFVMTLLTMPLAVMAGCAACAIAKKREHGPGRELVVLLGWSVLVQLAVFAFVMTPFDGVRLFLAVLPLVSIAAGLGLLRLWECGGAKAAAAVALIVLSPGAEFFVYQPYGMSYFTPVIGGLPGAERLGMEVTYYGEAIDPAGFASINQRARAGERVAYAPMFADLPVLLPFYYTRYGILDGRLAPAAPWQDWDYLMWINRGGAIGPDEREFLTRGRVIHENRLLGVTLSKVLRSHSHFAGDDR